MEAPGKLTSHTESERAEKFYAQALLLVDCCKIPEAIRLLEQAIELNPDCEIYRETLEFFQTSSFPGHLQSEQQGLSYANAARPKPNPSHGKENVSSRERKTKNATVNESPSRTPWPPAAMASCHSNAYEESTINNPWTSFVNRNSKRKKTQSSPIDGISEIEIPPLNETFCNQSPSSKQPTMSKDGMSVEYAQGDHINVSADHCECEKVNYHEAQYAHSGIPDESLDLRFLEELCRARETGTDDWTKYYDVLRSGLREDVTFSQSDYLHHNTQTNHAYSGTLDEITDPEDLKSRSELGKDQFERSTSNCSDLCSNCGHLKVSLNGSAPPSPTKNRIHFVNGVCVSSSSLPNCTCSKQNKSCSEERSAKSHLSSSQQEFYSNLQHYFGSGKVKSRKEDSSTKSSELNQKSSASCSTNASSTPAKEPLNIKSKQNVTESTNDERKHERRSSKEDLTSEVTDDDVSCDPRKVKTSSVEGEVKTKTKSFVDERFQPTGDKQKVGDHDRVRSKTKMPTKTEQVKNAKEGMSQSYSSHRRHTRVKDRAKGGHKGKAEDISRPVTASETRKKSSDKQKVKQTPQVEIDFTAIFTRIYRTGVTVMSKCFQVFKSIMYYIFLLLVLVFGFLIYCVWFASCWFVKKVLHYTAADRWFPAVKSKASAMFEWIRARREAQRKTSAQGQTYDLPKNGDAAIRHMLQNKDSDPYSVLGVPSDATDDDIRKQYRKLAVLIHPDKNSHSQADEAFKILANAFDILSDTEKRRDYDREAAWKKRAEDREGSFGHPGSPEQFFADLGRKMQEMQNYLHCNQCDGKHRRYSTDRFILTARYCSRCNARHAAKEGDLWAESSFLGYKLHFYACMEGEVYDVTEWAACQGIGNYRIEPNPHTVHLKLKTRQPQHSGFNSRSEEEDFENFMRAFFGQFNSSREERYHGSNKQGKRKRKKKR